MKKVLSLLFVSVSFYTVNGQCPVSARAMHTIWFNQTQVEPVIIDTICVIHIFSFPANSNVYLYNTSLTLVDSLTTDPSGSGYLILSPARCLTYGVGPSVGTAVSGSCTTDITGVGLLPIKIKSFAINTSNNKVTALWQLEEENAEIKYSLQESNNGRDFTTVYMVNNHISSIPGQQYQYQLPQAISAKRFYRLMITEYGGAVEYSAIKTALPKGYSAMDVYPTIGNGNLSVNVPENFITGEIIIFNTAGSIIQTKKITTSFFNIILSSGKGLYYLKAVAADGTILVKTILVQ